MEFGAAFVAVTEATELMQPTNRSFHRPACGAQSTAMFRMASSQHGLNVLAAQRPPMRSRIVRSIPLNPARPSPRSPWFPTDRWNLFHQRQQLRDIVRVGAGDRRRQRNALGVGD
jgi:hypothetical protein